MFSASHPPRGECRKQPPDNDGTELQQVQRRTLPPGKLGVSYALIIVYNKVYKQTKWFLET